MAVAFGIVSLFTRSVATVAHEVERVGQRVESLQVCY